MIRNKVEVLDFIPSKKEVEDYAEFLGMDLATDKELLHIAEEGIKAEVPAPWVLEEDKN